MKTINPRSLLLAFWVALVLIVGVAWFEWRHTENMRETAAWVTRTHEVQAEINRLGLLVNDIESSERGFIISGNSSFIDTLDVDKKKLADTFELLQQKISDPQQHVNLVALKALITHRVTLSERNISLRKNVGFAATQKVVAGGEGEVTMDKVHALLAQMDARQATLLEQRSAVTRNDEKEVMVWESIGGSVSLALFMAVFFVLRRENWLRQKNLQALEDAKSHAEQANAAKDMFLATMSHEIRTPLNGLLGMLELLGLSRLDWEQRQTLEIARDSGRGMGRIIDDILDHAKIEAGKMELLLEPVSLAQLLPSIVNTYYAIASTKDIVLRPLVDRRISPALMVDSLRLSQILNNFVSNALKFTSKGHVEIRADLLDKKADAEVVRLSVIDTGIGISAEAQQRMFQPFSQGGVDTSRLYGGTGLGLAICRRLTEMMGGEIKVESTLGMGTTMSVTLTLKVSPTPLADVAQKREQTKRQVEERRVDSSILITEASPLVLAVDDHPVNRLLLARQLAILGMRTQMAADGQEALTLWQNAGLGKYALVITDCNMGNMDGYTLTRAIREIEAKEGYSRIPVVAWTANSLSDAIALCHAAGMDDVLVKPCDLDKLEAILTKWVPQAQTAQTAQTAQAATELAASSLATPTTTTATTASQLSLTADLVREAEVPAIDRSMLIRAMGGDEAAALELLQNFRKVLPERISKLQALLITTDFDAIEYASHQFRGTAAMVGAIMLAGICARIETAAQAGDMSQIAALGSTFTNEAARVTKQLAQL